MPHTSRRRHALAAALLGLGMLFGFAAPARAVIMTYTLTGNMTGSLGTTNFSDTPFTWTQTGDTSAPTNVVGFPALAANTSTIQIGALPLATISTGFYTFFIDPADTIGFSNAGVDAGLAFSASGLDGYDFLAIGPLPVAVSSGSFPIPTDQGQWNLTGLDNLVFTASLAGAAIPEPTSLALLATGLLGLGLGLRRSRG